MSQEEVKIGDVSVPVIVDQGVRYYPVRSIEEKVLKRKQKTVISKSRKVKFSNFINKFNVIYGEKNVQQSNCISEEGLIEVLLDGQKGRRTIEQKVNENVLREYLGIELLKLENEGLIQSDYDEYTWDVINQVLEKNKNIDCRVCSRCETTYPLHERFFILDNRVEGGISKTCRLCTGKYKVFNHDDHSVYRVVKQCPELYQYIKDNDYIEVYNYYAAGKIDYFPAIYRTKEIYLEIIKYIINKHKINIYDISYKDFCYKYNIDMCTTQFSPYEIYKEIIGDDYYLFPWRFTKFQFPTGFLTYDIANQILTNYINEFNIKIDNVFTYDYEALLRKAKLSAMNKNMGDFLIQYYKHKYPGYMFKHAFSNYYKREDNVLHDLRYLIEEDMEIPAEKVPLYITKTTLQKKCSPLYNHIVTKKNGSLYEWINKLYPNKFIEADFEVNAYRNEFDSDQEMYIHEILTEKFGGNVIYNQKHTNRTVLLDGMIPDWIVITVNGVWVIEYFGLYVLRQKENGRVRDYIEKTHRKIERYKEMNNFNFIYLYPEDIEDDFYGVREKLSEIGKNAELVRV